MRFANNARLKEWLKDFPEIAAQTIFEVDADDFVNARDELRRQGIPDGELIDHAVYVCLTYGKEAPKKPAIPVINNGPGIDYTPHLIAVRRLLWAILTIIALILALSATGHAQGVQNPTTAKVVTACGTPPSNFPAVGQSAQLSVDTNDNLCAGVTVSASLSTNGLAPGVSAGVSTSGITGTPVFMSISTSSPSYVGNTYAPLSGDLTGSARVTCVTGCATPSDTVGVTVTLNGTTSSAAVAMSGQRGAEVQFGTCTGTSTIDGEVSYDGGTTWVGTVLIDAGGGASDTLSCASVSGNQYSIGFAGSISNARVRQISWTSGTAANVTVRGVSSSSLANLYGSTGAGGVIRQVKVTNTGLIQVDLSSTTANGTPINVNSSGSTSKLQDNAGNGITSTGNALDVNLKSGGSTGVGQGSGTSGQLGTLVFAAITTSAPAYIAGQSNALTMDSNGGLRIEGVAATGAAVLGAPVYVGANSGGNVAALAVDGASNLKVVAPLITFNSLPTLTPGQSSDLQIFNHGQLVVSIADTNGTIQATTPFNGGAAAVVSFETGNINTNISQVNGTSLATHVFGSGASVVVSFETSTIAISTSGPLSVQGNQGAGGNAVVIGFQTSNISVNLSQIAGNTPATHSFGGGVSSVVSFETSSLGVTAAQGGAASMANGWTVAVGMSSGGTNTALITDPCETSIGVTVSGSITTSTTIVTGTASKFISICYFYIDVNANATNWAMVEGTGTLCATNLAANFGGGTTAAAGPNWAANKAASFGVGRYALYTQTRAADNLCLLLSAANQVNYNLKYVVQ